jgi:hypothetical protein
MGGWRNRHGMAVAALVDCWPNWTSDEPQATGEGPGRSDHRAKSRAASPAATSAGSSRLPATKESALTLVGKSAPSVPCVLPKSQLEKKLVATKSFDEIVRSSLSAFLSELDENSMETDVKAAIIKEARRLIESDDEVKAKIREKLIQLIGKQ